MKLLSKKGSAEFVLFLYLLAGSIAVGETLLHFGLVDGHIAGDTSAHDISSRLASQYDRP